MALVELANRIITSFRGTTYFSLHMPQNSSAVKINERLGDDMSQHIRSSLTRVTRLTAMRGPIGGGRISTN